MSDSNTTLKKCAFCEQEFPATHEFFYSDTSHRDGLTSRCRKCREFKKVKEVLPDGYKRCTKCKEVKPSTLEYFYKHTTGLQPRCKVCLGRKQGYLEEIQEAKQLSEIGLQKCTKCGTEKPATTQYFNFNKKTNRLRTMCRTCHREYISPGAVKRIPMLPPAPEGYKICSKCLGEFPASEDYFSLHVRYKGGLTAWCKKCRFEYGSLYQKEKNRPARESREREYQREIDSGLKTCYQCKRTLPRSLEYFVPSKRNRDGLDKCRDCERERGHVKQVAAYKDPVRKAKILERARIADRKRYHSNPARRAYTKIINQARRANLRDSKKLWKVEYWQRCLEYFDYRCAVCGKPPGLWHTIAGDHWKPVSKGGMTTPDNIIPLCHSMKDGEGGCNNQKQKRSAEIWLNERYSKRKAKLIMKRIEDYFEWIKAVS